MTTTLDDRITAFLENRLGTAAQESARAEAAEAEAAECRAERAHYGDIMTSKLASAEAEIERLRSQVVTLEAQLQEVRTEYRVACEDFNELLEQTSDW